jgi:hypothetical protein
MSTLNTKLQFAGCLPQWPQLTEDGTSSVHSVGSGLYECIAAEMKDRESVWPSTVVVVFP